MEYLPDVYIEKTAAGKALESAIKKMQSSNNVVAKAGWFSSARYKESIDTKTGEITGSDKHVAEIAMQNEFGNPNRKIPPRPFMRPALIHGKKLLQEIVDSQAKKILSDQSTVSKALDLVSAKYVGLVKREIKNLYSPPLSPYTIHMRLERRRRKVMTATLTKPLIDTGVMFNTITNVVENE